MMFLRVDTCSACATLLLIFTSFLIIFSVNRNPSLFIFTSLISTFWELTFYTLIENFFHALFNVCIILSGNIKVFQVIFLCGGLCWFKVNFSVINHIVFVAYKNFRNTLISVFINWVDPIFDIIECLLISDVKCNDNSICLFIKWVC